VGVDVRATPQVRCLPRVPDVDLTSLSSTSIERYEDQTDIFYKNVSAYLHKHFPATVDPAFPPAPCPMTKMSECTWQHEWPRVLVMFGALLNEPEIPLILQDKGYVQTWYGTNGFEEDARRRGGVVVWKWVK
jgi:phosphatidylinositol glycan class B